MMCRKELAGRSRVRQEYVRGRVGRQDLDLRHVRMYLGSTQRGGIIPSFERDCM